MCREFKLDALAERARGRDRSTAAIQIPTQRVAAAGLQPAITAVCRKKPLDRFGSQGTGRNADAVPAPISIQTDAVKLHNQRIARLRAFDIERACEDVIVVQDQLACFITAARIKALGDYSVARAYVGNGRVRCGKRS